MKKALTVLALVLVGGLVLWVGNGLREELPKATQAGVELGEGARRAQCVQAAVARAEACEGLFCGMSMGPYLSTCLALAEPDGTCESPAELHCEGFACEQVRTQLTQMCPALSVVSPSG